jgi:hypothetical protein
MANTVNRSLADKHFDKIDHALGRPLDPVAETYRNHYAITDTSPQTAEFRASPHWDEAPRSDVFNRMIFFYVNAEGRQALAAHLRKIGDPHRAFEVIFDGHPCTVVAKTHGEARYLAYLRTSDGWSELTFLEFQKRSSVKRQTPKLDGREHNEMPERASK